VHHKRKTPPRVVFFFSGIVGNLAVLYRINFELFGMAEVLKYTFGFISSCKFHRILVFLHFPAS
jgi:hypothetical protein